jgi:hypothetical protein
MQECFRAHPEDYPDELDDDDEEGEYVPLSEGEAAPEGTAPELSISKPLATSGAGEEKVATPPPVQAQADSVPAPESVKQEKQDPTFSAK